jgi:cobalt-zinc-cadmium efflux system outer membrane protein
MQRVDGGLSPGGAIQWRFVDMMKLALFFLFFLYCSTVHSMTMDEAVGLALQNNPEIQALRMEEKVAKGQMEKARLPLAANPTVQTDVSTREGEPQGNVGRGANYGFGLLQEFEIAGQRGARIGIAAKNLSRVSFLIRDQERILTYDVKDAFARTLAAKSREELTAVVVNLQEELLGFTRIKFQAGDVSALQVNLAEVELSRAKKDLLSARREYREALLALQGLMGMKPELTLTVEGNISLGPTVLPDKEELKNLALQRRPDIKVASYEVDTSQGTVDLVNRLAVPNVTLGGFFDRDDRRNAVGLLFSVPIPLFDRKQAEKMEAKAREDQARIRRSGLSKTVERELEEAYGNLSTALDEISIFQKETVNKAMENLSLLHLAFQEGKISFFDVRVAQRETFEIQFAYLDTLYRGRRAFHALERVIGGDLQ